MIINTTLKTPVDQMFKFQEDIQHMSQLRINILVGILKIAKKIKQIN